MAEKKILTEPLRLKVNPILKRPSLSSIKQLNSSANQRILNKDDSSQSAIPIKRIEKGIIQTTDNVYCAIVEVYPVNFYQKTVLRQEQMLSLFEKIFINLSSKYHIKILSDVPNPSKFIDSLQKRKRMSTSEKIKNGMDDYILLIQNLCHSSSIQKRYLLSFEYSGDEHGKRSSVYDEISASLLETREYIVHSLAEAGCFCNEPIKSTNYDKDIDMFHGEILYQYFNRNTCLRESFQSRYERMKHDLDIYNQTSEIKKKLSFVDLIAPKGLHFWNRNYNMMDGMYYTYLILNSESYPSRVVPGWLDIFNYGNCIDVDLITKKLPRQITKTMLKQSNNNAGFNMRQKLRKNRGEQAEAIGIKLKNNQGVYNALNGGEDIFNCCIILTLRSDTVEQLLKMQRFLKRDLFNKYEIVLEDSFLCSEECFYLTMPLTRTNAVFDRNVHNIVTHDYKTLFPFTGYSLFEPKGFVIGKNSENNSLLCPDNFNTNLYSNANMCILGTSGAGKTFTEQLIARHSFYAGCRCYLLIPKKGIEYKRSCEDLDGTFVTLAPGSRDVINILELVEEGQIDKSLLGDDAAIPINGNPVAKKTSVITTWIQLLLGKDSLNIAEIGILNRCITKMYEDFGFSTKSDSLRGDDGNIKPMPIIEDLKRYVDTEPQLSKVSYVLDIFVNGSCSNFNAQTNIDRKSPYIVFNIDGDIIPPELLPAFMYIAFDMTYSEVKSQPNQKDLVILDETWQMMKHPDSADQVFSMVKLIRGYGGGTVVATQEINDFINLSHGKGVSIINNSTIKLFLRMEESDLQLLRGHVKLTDEDEKKILGLTKGHGLFIANGDKISAEIISSELELKLFNTDINLRQKWEKEEKASASHSKTS